MAQISSQETRWRAMGPYLSTLASKAALLEETRLFLITYGQNHDLEITARTLLNNMLAQRSRETRTIILDVIQARLTRWHPPAWVLQDLVTFANETSLDALRAALLLHVPRQDHVLYDFVQEIVVPRRQYGDNRMLVADVQTFFDTAQETHPEIDRWGFETRLRLARGVLATLRDYALLKGAVNKDIVLPVIPERVIHHLIRLLQAENISQAEMAKHPDWHLWLWGPVQAQIAIEAFFKQEQIA